VLKSAVALGAMAWATPELLEATGVLSTAAGATAVAGPNGPATMQIVATNLGRPLGLCIVPGAAYVADFDGHSNPAESGPGRILRVALPGGQVTTVLSDPNAWPTDVAVDAVGNIYLLDYGEDADDTGQSSSGTKEGGRVLVLAPGRTTPKTLFTGLVDPSYLLLDGQGQHLYVSNAGDPDDPGGHVVLSCPLTGKAGRLTVAGNGAPSGAGVCPPSVGPQAAGTVAITVPFGLALFGSSLFVADEYAHVVYRVDLGAGTLTRYAGTCDAGQAPWAGTGDGGPATAATVPYPQGLTADGFGNLYILQIQGQVRRVDASSGVITTIYPGPPTCDSNTGIAFDPSDGSLYYTSQDTQNLMRLTQS
jgi:sugar lactone lactonase YvrE